MTEQQLETTAIGWLGKLGWGLQYAHDLDIAPDGDLPARTDYRQVVLGKRLLSALAHIKPQIPAAAVETAAHELLKVSEPLLIARNRRIYRLLLAGVPVEFSSNDDNSGEMVSDLANTNVAVVVSDGFTARLETLTANQQRMQFWRASSSVLPDSSSVLDGSPSVLDGSSSVLDGSSSVLDGSSSVLDGSSSVWPQRDKDGYLRTDRLPLPVINDLGALSAALRRRLERLAAEPRQKKKMNPDEMEKVILAVCEILLNAYLARSRTDGRPIPC